MTSPAFASLDDLADRLEGGLDDDDVLRALAALDDASALIRSEAGKTWVTSGALDDDVPDVIVSITLAVAKRAFENPTGATSQSVGDASQSFGGTGGKAAVYLTADELRAVKRANGRGGLGSIDLEIGTPGWSGDVIYVLGQDEPMAFTYEPLRP